MIEIQLRTVMMDSWASINHKVQYKAIGGKPSTQEYRVLDTVKGLASTGEVLLEHLHEVHQSRLESDKLPIQDEAHLNEVLAGFFRELGLNPNTRPDADNIKALFRLVTFLDITRVDRLRRTLKVLEIEEIMKKSLNPSISAWFRGRSAVSKLDIILYSMLGKLSDQARDLMCFAAIRNLFPWATKDGFINAPVAARTAHCSLFNVLNSAAEIAADAEFHEEDIEACAML